MKQNTFQRIDILPNESLFRKILHNHKGKIINARGNKCKRLLGITIDNNYNIQYKCWGLLRKVSSKTYVFVTVALHFSISKRRVQWTFVIANMTSNKFFATSKTFHSPITLDHGNSYNIRWYIEYRFLRITPYIDPKKKKKSRSFYQIYLLNSVSEFERCLFRRFESQ